MIKESPFSFKIFTLCPILLPQDAYNAGQKLYMYLVILATLGIMLSGIVITFNEFFPKVLKQNAQPIHWVSVLVVVAGLMGHVSMGAFATTSPIC